MTASIHRCTALLTLVGLLVVPTLPPEHLHRGTDVRRGRPLIHRHFAPHMTPTGTHVDRPGVAEGAPVWLADPPGALPDWPVLGADVTRSLLHIVAPRHGPSHRVVSSSETVQHGPPRGRLALRGPPSHA